MGRTKYTPYGQNTVTGTISAGKSLSISESSIAFKSVIDSGEDKIAITYYNVITKYYRILKPYIESYTMTDNEYLTYKNKPNYFCYMKYDTPELASSLLYINNMTSATEFTRQTIKKFKSNIISVLNELMTLNDKDIKKNRIENNID